MEVGKKQREILAPICWFSIKGKMIILFNWIDGVTLEEFYKNKSTIEQIIIAIEVGKIISNFHKITKISDHPKILIEKNIVNEFTSKYLSEEYKLKFCSLISEFNKTEYEYSLIHYDLRPANIMIDCDGNLTIIDFEYMNYYPSYADLSLNFLFSEKYLGFGYGVLYGYYGIQPNEFFWKNQKPLLAVELLRLHNSRRNNDVINKIVLIEDYLFTDQLVPKRFHSIYNQYQKFKEDLDVTNEVFI